MRIEKYKVTQVLSQRMLVAIRHQDDETFDALLKEELAFEALKGYPVIDGGLVRLLAEAIRQCKPEYIDEICRKGIDPDASDIFEYGISPLYQAIDQLLTLYVPSAARADRFKDVSKVFAVAKCIEKLIQHGASLNKKCPLEDETCLELLASRECGVNHPLTKYLLSISGHSFNSDITQFIESELMSPADHKCYVDLVGAVVERGLFGGDVDDLRDENPAERMPVKSPAL